MFPLQGHHIHHTESAGVERKEEDFQYSCGGAGVMYFRQTNLFFEKKNSRDKQIVFVYRVDI